LTKGDKKQKKKDKALGKNENQKKTTSGQEKRYISKGRGGGEKI